MTEANTTATAPPVRRSQPERRAEAEQRLLLAACEVVARKGTVGMTLAEVGEVAGYSRGLAAHHFGNKAGLLRALVGYINHNFMTQLHAGPPRQPGLDSIKGFVSVYLNRTDRNWTSTRALLLLLTESMLETSETYAGLAEYNGSVIKYLENQLRFGIESGEIRQGLDAKASAALIIGALRGVMLQHLLKDAELDLVAIRDQLLTFLDQALTEPKPARASS